MSWSEYTRPQGNAILVYARRLAGENRPAYSYTAVNLLGTTRHPFHIRTSVETGIAQYLGAFGPFHVYGAGTFGSSPIVTQDGGTATGYAVTGAGIALAEIGKGWRIGPYLRVTQPSLAERQWAIGLMLGWGQ